ncbi:MAG: J domain-containing protein [Pseudomonadota bacterium]
MPPRSPLDFDISVTADKERRARLRGRPRSMGGRVDTSEKRCEWPGCNAPAAYRAPRSPEDLTAFRWFCLEHVREYNAAWNFFQNWSEAEIDQQFNADRVWDRPTWSMGTGPKSRMGLHPHGNGEAWARWGFHDPLEVLGENATMNPGNPGNAGTPGAAEAAKAPQSRPRRRLTREEQRAMDTLGLAHQIESRREVRARYAELVKELHPDMNGGQNPEPERLSRIIKAWRILRKSRNFADSEAA